MEVQNELDAPEWFDAQFTGCDAIAPQLNSMLTDVEDLPRINELAKSLQELKADGQLTKFKAVVDATQCETLDDVFDRIEKLPQYCFETKIRDKDALVRDELEFVLGGKDADLIYKHLNCEAYAEDVLKQYGAEITPYEDAAHHNAVFIGTDEGNCPRHAHLRSTNSFGKAFRLNVESSDPRYSFHHTGTDGSLYVFEAPIDMLSYISMNPHQWQEHSYVACCGTSPIPVMQMLNPDTQIVYLCLDNDKAGHAASERMAEQLRERGVMTERLVPELKDWNDDLLHAQKEELAPCLSL